VTVRKTWFTLALAGCLVGLALAPAGFAQRAPEIDASTGSPQAQSAVAPHGMVVSQDGRATEIGVDVLKRGGNAVDAAVAVGFALAVTLPRAGNLGGGGFMVVHLAGQDRPIAIDYRETAPEGTTQDVFLDENGDADPKKSRSSGLAVGVPGTVAGLALAHARYGSGKFSLAKLIAPAIALAQNGVSVTEDMFDTLTLSGVRLQRWPSSSVFFKPDGTPLGLGDTLVQPDLARSLSAIAEGGPQAFYHGPIAEKIAASVRSAGGRMTVADLNSYEAIEREAVRGTYRGFDIISMPPPSSGGVHLIEMLNILEGFPLASLGARSPQALHLMIEAMKLAYADRAEFLGDSDAVTVPVARLISKSYAASLREQIDPIRARPSREIRPGSPALEAKHNTTHFSVVDGNGNAVANTTTLNFNYGLGLVAAGTGILLNNELDDFAAKPGAPNAFGLVGGSANAPGPGKRPLSSMTPTIVLKNNQPVLVTGSPGGSRIITTVLQVVLNVLEFNEDLADAVAAPRLHHQWQPDYVLAEPGFPPATIQGLEALGHTVRIGPLSGSAHSVAVAPNGLVGAADERSRGALAAGY